MASRLRLPTLAFAILSIGLNLAILGCAGRTLHIYNTQRNTNAYFLPVWANHFDTREITALIATSAIIFFFNAITAIALFVPKLPSNFIVLACSLLTTILSLIAIIFSTILNNHAPRTDTLQTWTCRWSTVANQNVPEQFSTMCQETRFAFYTTIPSLILQLLLVTLSILALTSRPHSPRGMRINDDDGEKEVGDDSLELRPHPHFSFEPRTGSGKGGAKQPGVSTMERARE